MRRLGFPRSLYEELFAPSPMARAKAQATPLATSTPAYVECLTAMELGMSLGAYRALPRKERMEWLLFVILRNKKQEFAEEEARRSAEREASRSTPPQGPAKFR